MGRFICISSTNTCIYTQRCWSNRTFGLVPSFSKCDRQKELISGYRERTHISVLPMLRSVFSPDFNQMAFSAKSASKYIHGVSHWKPLSQTETTKMCLLAPSLGDRPHDAASSVNRTLSRFPIDKSGIWGQPKHGPWGKGVSRPLEMTVNHSRHGKQYERNS